LTSEFLRREKLEPVSIPGFFEVGPNRPFLLIGGPCVIESADLCREVAAGLKEICARLGISYMFKASFDKANRTSLASFRGPGLEEGLRILADIRQDFGVPVVADVHEVAQVGPAAEVLDVLQIPAFLCRPREKKIPYFGICLGMQLAVIEFARHIAKMKDADSTEFNQLTKHPVIYFIKEWFDYRTGKIQIRDESTDLGGTLRLGAYPCKMVEGTFAHQAYGADQIEERHRHRYEFNNAFKDELVKHGLIVSGTSPDEKLVEIVELPDHPWFLGCQFHPEFKSGPMKPHPLFKAFIKAALENAGL